MSIEGVYRATSRNLFKEIRRENFEKCLVDYKRLMLFIGDEKSLVEKGALLRTNDNIETSMSLL